MGKPDQETQATWAGALQLIASRNETSLAFLYDQTSPYVHSLALRILGNPADAEEVTLDVYIQVWRKAAHYQVLRGSPLGWLLMMTRSRAIDRLRSRVVASDPINLQGLVSKLQDPESGHSDREQSKLMNYWIGCLPAEQQMLIDCAFFQGMTQSEMALALDLPLGTVKTRMRLGLKKLRIMLETGRQIGAISRE